MEREARGTIDKIEEEQHTGRPGPCVWINGHGGLCQRGRKDDAAQQIINCNEKSPNSKSPRPLDSQAVELLL